MVVLRFQLALRPAPCVCHWQCPPPLTPLVLGLDPTVPVVMQ